MDPPPRIYVVRRGDTLAKIAEQKLGDDNRWREIFALNGDVITNPNRISPGQVLVLPPPPALRRSGSRRQVAQDNVRGDGKAGVTGRYMLRMILAKGSNPPQSRCSADENRGTMSASVKPMLRRSSTKSGSSP